MPLFSSSGSSPRVRGKLDEFLAQEGHLRIIPARAGQTSTPMSPKNSRPDHPRACGANQNQLRTMGVDIGSSPRVRGKPTDVKRAPHTVRIIPARAGQTRLTALTPYPTSDHPRACGANISTPMAWIPVIGSSPRVRGKPLRRFRGQDTHRIIPARAGQTATSRGVPVGLTDHPRACGANLKSCSLPVPPIGSSPRVRGKLGHCH